MNEFKSSSFMLSWWCTLLLVYFFTVTDDVLAANCQFYEKGSGVTYDLSTLYRDDGNWEAIDSREGDNFLYHINVCGAIHSPESIGDGCVAGSGGCQSKPSDDTAHAYSLGESSDTLTRVGGALELRYAPSQQDEKLCHGLYNRNMRIIFLCREKSVGRPVFIFETESCEYVFQWETIAACDEGKVKETTDCFAQNEKTGLTYDFSSLASRSWTAIKKGLINYNYVLSICNKLDSAVTSDNDCSSKMGACRYDKDGAVSLGISESPVVSDHAIVVKYSGGDRCTDSMNHTAIISFVCKRGVLGSPVFLSTLNCENTFLWKTDAACEPEPVLNSTSCIISSPATYFDVSSLRNEVEDYTISSDKYSVKLNPCGALLSPCGSSKTAAACQTVPSDESFTPKVLGEASLQKLQYSTDALTLTYSGGDICGGKFKRKIVISFECDSSAQNTKPRFVFEDGQCVYFYVWHSSVACRSPLLDCVTKDADGNVFDLSSLANPSENWVVYDQDQTYYINVCHALNIEKATGTIPCEDPKTSICMVSNNSSYNLGNAHNVEYIDNGVVMNVVGTEKCPIDESSNRGASIRFECNKDNLLGNPHFENNVGCLSIFTWPTKFVCKPDEPPPIDTEDCTITKGGIKYDLSSLTKDGGFYQISNGSYEYELNICASGGSGACKEKEHSSLIGICQSTADGKAFDLGHFTGHLELPPEGDTIILKYEDGDRCRSSIPRVTQIMFICDRDAASPGSPSFVSENHCVYEFQWRTQWACSPQKEVYCAVKDVTGSVYNFDSLARSWTVDVDGETYIVAICRNLDQAEMYKCDPYAGVCKVPAALGLPATNLGRIASPVISNGKIIMEYDGGDQCGKNSKIKTDIEFKCVPGDPGSLKFKGKDECKYSFIMETMLACDDFDHNPDKGDNCTVAHGNVLYDLSRLTKDEDYKVENDPFLFELNVCGPLKNSKCGKNVGACEINNGNYESMGIVSRKLEYKDSKIVLTYAGGARCLEKKRETIITFDCDKSVPFGEPVLESRHNCNASFLWTTSFACPPAKVDCVVYDGHENTYDLSALGKSNGNWDVYGDGTHFLLNVCRDINPVDDAKRCNGGVCKFKESSLEKLGVVSSPIIENNELMIKYKYGEPCSDPSKSTMSSIKFKCDHTTIGRPIFESSNDCNYVFSWKSKYACPLDDVVNGLCSVSVNGDEFDLSSLNSTDGYKVTSDNAEYLLNVCAPIATGPCKNGRTAACQKWKNGTTKSIGSLSRNLQYINNVVDLTYEGGDACGNEKAKTIIHFSCDQAVGIGHPKLVDDAKCIFTFTWKTNIVCKPDSEVSKSNTTGIVVGVTVGVVAIIGGFLILRNRRRREALCSANCFGKKDSSSKHLGDLEALINHLGSSSGDDEDDDLLAL